MYCDVRNCLKNQIIEGLCVQSVNTKLCQSLSAHKEKSNTPSTHTKKVNKNSIDSWMNRTVANVGSPS